MWKGVDCRLGHAMLPHYHVSELQAVARLNEGGIVELTSHGVNPTSVRRAGSCTWQQLSCGDRVALQDGDRVALDVGSISQGRELQCCLLILTAHGGADEKRADETRMDERADEPQRAPKPNVCWRASTLNALDYDQAP